MSLILPFPQHAMKPRSLCEAHLRYCADDVAYILRAANRYACGAIPHEPAEIADMLDLVRSVHRRYMPRQPIDMQGLYDRTLSMDAIDNEIYRCQTAPSLDGSDARDRAGVEAYILQDSGNALDCAVTHILPGVRAPDSACRMDLHGYARRCLDDIYMPVAPCEEALREDIERRVRGFRHTPKIATPDAAILAFRRP